MFLGYNSHDCPDSHDKGNFYIFKSISFHWCHERAIARWNTLPLIY